MAYNVELLLAYEYILLVMSNPRQVHVAWLCAE